MKPKHGEIKSGSQHTRRTWVNEAFNAAGNQKIDIRYVAREESAKLRWCAVCRNWVESAGIIGALMCPGCNTPWIIPNR